MLAELLPKIAGFEKEGRGMYRPRPSLAGPERCIRQMVYWANGTIEDKAIGDRFILTMDDSSWHEHLTADWLRKSTYNLHSEQMGIDCGVLNFLPEEPARHCDICNRDIPNNTWHGHIDGIVQDMLGKDTHYEHKAINRFAFERYWKGEYPMDYLCQCCIYQTGIRKLLPDLDHSVLLVKCKDTARYLDFLIHYDHDRDIVGIKEVTLSSGEKQAGNPYLVTAENFLADAYAKFENVNWHVEQGTLPERPYPLGTNFPCGYCSWSETCWEGYGDEFQAMQSGIALPEELANAARYYKELAGREADTKKEKEEVRDQIKKVMKAHNARKGIAGEYELDLRLQHRDGYTVEPTDFEILYVKNLNAKKGKK